MCANLDQELEIEKLKKRLDELQEWKIQIEENGLEESLTDIDLSLSSGLYVCLHHL